MALTPCVTAIFICMLRPKNLCHPSIRLIRDSAF
jgi:hypothetical protein